MIDREQTALSTAEQTLDTVDGMTPEARRDTHEHLTDGYATLERGQRLVDQHLKHNRFWQRVIAEDRVVRVGLARSFHRAQSVVPTILNHDLCADQPVRRIGGFIAAVLLDERPEYIGERLVQSARLKVVLEIPLVLDDPMTELVTDDVQALCESGDGG